MPIKLTFFGCEWGRRRVIDYWPPWIWQCSNSNLICTWKTKLINPKKIQVGFHRFEKKSRKNCNGFRSANVWGRVLLGVRSWTHLVLIITLIENEYRIYLRTTRQIQIKGRPRVRCRAANCKQSVNLPSSSNPGFNEKNKFFAAFQLINISNLIVEFLIFKYFFARVEFLPESLMAEVVHLKCCLEFCIGCKYFQ